jgi:hypothetical protein
LRNGLWKAIALSCQSHARREAALAFAGGTPQSPAHNANRANPNPEDRTGE